jgi:hypothetical protein
VYRLSHTGKRPELGFHRSGIIARVTHETLRVGEVVGGFFGSVKGIHHELSASWEEEDMIICHGTVTYTRHDSTMLSVPFANILVVDGDLINKYLVFVDVSELF